MGCGETEGADVGLLLGWPEGACEGCLEGSTVGAVDGCRVGGNSILLVATKTPSMVVIGKLLLVVNILVAFKDTLFA